MDSADAKTTVFEDKIPPARGWCRTSLDLLAYYESKLLGHLSVPFKSYPVSLQTDEPHLKSVCKEHINTLEICPDNKNRESKPTLVVIHGFASGLGVFINSYAALSTQYRVFAIDLLGFGRSSKPRFPAIAGDEGAGAEGLFVDSIEAWRIRQGLGPLVLCGHSFGGYLATSYCLKYPAAVAGLVLVDPWGLPHPPPDPPQPTLRRRILGFVSTSVSPMGLLRAAGPLGPALFERTRRDLWDERFAGIGAGDEVKQYLYHANVQSTGDTGFRRLLAPFAYARRPILARAAGLDPAVPATLLYGADSWINPSAGEHFAAARGPAAATFIEMIPGAGHHIYADQPDLFVAAILRAARRLRPGTGGGGGVNGSSSGGGGGGGSPPG